MQEEEEVVVLVCSLGDDYKQRNYKNGKRLDEAKTKQKRCVCFTPHVISHKILTVFCLPFSTKEHLVLVALQVIITVHRKKDCLNSFGNSGLDFYFVSLFFLIIIKNCKTSNNKMEMRLLF